MKKLLVLLVASIALVGCDVDVKTNITTDDLLSNDRKIVNGQMSVEVMSCRDFRDSRNESRSLEQARTQIKKMVEGSEFVECYDKNMKSFAIFNIPVVTGSGSSDGESVSGDIYLLSSDQIFLSVALSPRLVEKIKREESDPFSMNTKVDLNMTIVIEAGAKPISNVLWQSVYLSDSESNPKQSPQIVKGTPRKATGKIVVTLSDVAVDQIKNGEIAHVGWYPAAFKKALQ